MKKLVVFYSLEGNTRLVAGRIAEAIQADMIELVPESQPSPSGISRFVKGGRAAMKGETPKLAPFGTDPEDYDLIFLGSPVWAWTFSPPLRSFLMEHDLSGRKVALFMCHGGGPGKAMEKLEKAVEGASLLGGLLLQDPLKRDTDVQLGKAGSWAIEMLGKAQSLS